mgnify:CR=1 FL=1
MIEIINGSKGFLKILNKLTRVIQPDMTIVVWDGEGGSQKRRSENKNYKQGRKPIRLNRDIRHLTEEQEAENKIWQQMRAIEYLNQTPIIQFMEPRVEADDVISHITQSNHFSDWQKVIVSSDKDFFQLLDDKTILYRPTQDQVLNKKKVIMGFGHRVYRTGDSRVPTMKHYMFKVAKLLKKEKYTQIYEILEKVMLEKKNIHPNVDFPCGPTYYMMGIDIDFYTPIFVMSRITGWSAHIMEQHASNKLIRPLSKYKGQEVREVMLLNQR